MAAQSQDSSKVVNMSAESRRILIIDDERTILMTLEALLTRHGFQPETAANASYGLRALKEKNPAVVLLDLQLPDAPGDQVYKTAKHIDPDLNVIVITGYPDSEVLDRILQISPVTVLKKPLKIEQLNQTVKILGHSTARVES
jgi:DNA-binding NtrC family response regulator